MKHRPRPPCRAVGAGGQARKRRMKPTNMPLPGRQETRTLDEEPEAPANSPPCDRSGRRPPTAAAPRRPRSTPPSFLSFSWSPNSGRAPTRPQHDCTSDAAPSALAASHVHDLPIMCARPAAAAALRALCQVFWRVCHADGRSFGLPAASRDAWTALWVDTARLRPTLSPGRANTALLSSEAPPPCPSLCVCVVRAAPQPPCKIRRSHSAT